MLYPSVINPVSSDLSIVYGSSDNLAAATTNPPAFWDMWIKRVTVIGTFMLVIKATRCIYTLEDNACFIAKDLTVEGDHLLGKTVGVIEIGKAKSV